MDATSRTVQGGLIMINILQEKRKAAGITQIELARKISVSRVSIGNWETGRKKISLEHAIAYADALGYDVVLQKRCVK